MEWVLLELEWEHHIRGRRHIKYAVGAGIQIGTAEDSAGVDGPESVGEGV
jgi:hypothetical protein